MSGRPDIRRLSDEELDVLLSRSLDGDLSPDEERELSEVLASDPRASHRREELAALVGRLQELPIPAPPLGHTARVNAHAADRSKGMGALGHRLGLFPPPSMVRGIAALFVIVLIGIGVLRNQSERQKAEEQAAPHDDGRVSIFLGEKKAAAPAAPVAIPQDAKAPAAKPSAPRKDAEVRLAEDSRARRSGTLVPKEEGRPAAVAADAATASRADAPAKLNSFEARSEAASNEPPVRQEALAKKMKLQAGGAAAPAPASAVHARTLSWSVRVVGSPGWLLKKAPETAPSAPVSARCVVTLDLSGRVVAVRPADGAPLPPEVETLARGLLFSRSSSAPAEEAPTTVEIEVETR